MNTQHATRNTQPWLWMPFARGEAALNMAMDEALLEAMPRWQKPVLRYYGWTESPASFGYFQKFSEVESATLLRPLVRRPTGGGIVPHDIDWTYSMAFPTVHEWYATSAIESYRRVHDWIRAAFEGLNVVTELAPCCRKSAPGQCFVGYEKFDLLWHGKKIAGAAQRRNKLGLLIQGSVQPAGLGLMHGNWDLAMREMGTRLFGAQWAEAPLDELLQTRVAELVREKYSQQSYNEKR